MGRLLRLLVATTVLSGTVPAQAQHAAPIPHQPAAFAAWRPSALAAEAGPSSPYGAGTAISRKGRRALIGGAIGAVAGLAVCTVISNMTDEGAAGFSTCTWKGYLLTGGIGFGVGFAAGWLL